MENVLKLSALEISRLIKKKEISPIDVFNVHAKLIEKYNPVINAAVEMNFDEGRKRALQMEQVLQKKNSEDLPLFFGVPFTCKEMIAVKNFKWTGGTYFYKNQVSQQSATVVDRLEKAGAILLATTNVPEMGFWFETNNTVYGRTSNPYNETRTSGGSSGGEGALIGLGASPMGIASDIGGSIRIPSSFCGVFGHKPTNRVIPSTGHFPNSTDDYRKMTEENYPLTTIGPICRKAKDLLPMMKVLSGPDGIDPLCKLPANFLKNSSKKVKKIFFINDPLIHGASRSSEEIKNCLEKTSGYFEQVGYEIHTLPEDFFLRGLHLWISALNHVEHKTYAQLVSPDSEFNPLSEMLKLVTGKSRHTLPSYVLSLFDGKVMSKEIADKGFLELQQLKQKLHEVLTTENVIILPTQPHPAPKHNSLFLTPFDFIYCGVFNALGNPATHVPIELNSQKLPIGVQIISPLGHDHLGISLAEELEMAFGGWMAPEFKEYY